MSVCTHVMYLNNILPVCQFKNKCWQKYVETWRDKYWRDECKWVQQISVEIFDENICSGDVQQEIKIHYGNILVMYVTNVKWVGGYFWTLSLCI